MAIPATSAPSERDFSVAGITIAKEQSLVQPSSHCGMSDTKSHLIPHQLNSAPFKHWSYFYRSLFSVTWLLSIIKIHIPGDEVV